MVEFFYIVYIYRTNAQTLIVIVLGLHNNNLSLTLMTCDLL